MIAGLFVIALLVYLFPGTPIFITMIIPSTCYLLNVLNMQPIMAVSSFTVGLNKFSALCLPFFTLAVSVMGKGQIGSKLLEFCRNVVGHVCSDIGITTIVCYIIIGAVSGASTAGILIMGALIYQKMIDNGYPWGFSAGLICTISSVGMLIPPDIAFAIYTMNINIFVSKLLMGDLGPGIIMAVMFMVYVYVYARKHKVPRLPRISPKEFFTTVKEAIWALGLPVIIIGTMYTSICMPTETVTMLAVYAIFVKTVIYKDVGFKALIDICRDCAKTVCTIYILLTADQLLGYVMTLIRIPQLTEAILGSASGLVILLVISIMFLIVSMSMGAGSSTVIIMLMVYQLALKTRIDPTFLGSMVTTNLAIDMNTPPFGLSLPVSVKVMKLSFVKIVRSSMPFIVLTILVFVIITPFPGLSLFFPNLLVEQQKQGRQYVEDFKAAPIVVGVTRTHLNYDFNYPPVPEDDCQRMLGGLVKVIPEFRSRGLPVVFVRTGHKINPLTGETTSLVSPFWRCRMENKISIGGHMRRLVNAENLPAMGIMPQLDAEEQDIIVRKQRYNAFVGTPLEMYLRVMGINTLFFTGANTNNCVLCTTFEAYNRDYRVIAIEDYCAGMNGKAYHELVIMQIKASLGRVVDSGSVANILDGRAEL